MQHFVKKCIVGLVCVGLVHLSMPRRAHGGGDLPQGRGSADEAASLTAHRETSGHALSEGWRYAFASADTTDYEFPEEEKQRNIVKEVAMYVVISAFVAFFIIKVFLEGDTDTPPPQDGGGKNIP